MSLFLEKVKNILKRLDIIPPDFCCFYNGKEQEIGNVNMVVANTYPTARSRFWENEDGTILINETGFYKITHSITVNESEGAVGSLDALVAYVDINTVPVYGSQVRFRTINDTRERTIFLSLQAGSKVSQVCRVLKGESIYKTIPEYCSICIERLN